MKKKRPNIVFKFDVVDREILKNLLKNKKLDWYYLHEKYRLSPGQLSRSFKKLIRLKFILVGDESIEITEEGLIKTITMRKIILRKNEDEFWSKLQDERKGAKIKVNQFYLPNVKKI